MAPFLVGIALSCAPETGSAKSAEPKSGASKKPPTKASVPKVLPVKGGVTPAVVPKVGAVGTLLVLVGPDAGEAHFKPASGWTTGTLDFQFKAACIAPHPGAAVAVLRRSSPVPDENDELFWATWKSDSGFDSPKKVGSVGFSSDGPAASSLGASSLATFLGIDFKHYEVQNTEGTGYGPFGPIPGGTIQTQAFGPSATSLAGDGAGGAYAVYAGNDSHLYYTRKAGPDSAWAASAEAPASLSLKTVRPFALVDSDKNLRIFYVRQSDKRICTIKLVSASTTWSAEETVGEAATALTPSVAPTSSGDFIVAYHGAVDQGIYFVRGKDGAWGAGATIESPAAVATTAPIALPGLAGADAEILYAAGGVLKHARLLGMSAPAAIVAGPVNVTNLAAAIVP